MEKTTPFNQIIIYWYCYEGAENNVHLYSLKTHCNDVMMVMMMANGTTKPFDAQN